MRSVFICVLLKEILLLFNSIELPRALGEIFSPEIVPTDIVPLLSLISIVVSPVSKTLPADNHPVCDLT